MPTLLSLLGIAGAYLLGAYAQRIQTRSEREPEALESASEFSWRQINLAIGDGYLHSDADPALAALRAAGWSITKCGSERAGFVYLKLIPGNQNAK